MTQMYLPSLHGNSGYSILEFMEFQKRYQVKNGKKPTITHHISSSYYKKTVVLTSYSKRYVLSICKKNSVKQHVLKFG